MTIPTPIPSMIPPVQPDAAQACPSSHSTAELLEVMEDSSQRLRDLLADADAEAPPGAEHLLDDLEGVTKETAAAAVRGLAHVDAILTVCETLMRQSEALGGLLARLDLQLAELENRQQRTYATERGSPDSPSAISPSTELGKAAGAAWARGLERSPRVAP